MKNSLILTEDENKLLELAITSTNKKMLDELAKSTNTNIRRAVSKNKNASMDTIDRLILDPTLNVSYIASKNVNGSIKRTFNPKLLTACVVCEQDERFLNCSSCGENVHIH